jgi:DNA-binding LacI/PurR family transcriptional regulator
MEGRRVSIRDVAREAGVSVTTVSHALNDKGRLNPATRERVRDIARRLGYRPNPAARSLVSGRTGLIAVVASLPSGAHAELGDFGYFADLIGAATGVAVARDVALVVAPSEDDPFVWDRVSLDGVIVAGPMAGDAALAALRERRIPFVTIGRDPEGGHEDAIVDTDEDASTRAVLDHLVQAGARRVGTIGLPPSFSSTRTRVEAYQRWCEEHRVSPAVAIVGFDDLLRDRIGAVADAVRRLVDDPNPVDAIYAPVEQIGMATLQVLRARGARVPDDIMLATTNDAGRADTASPPVTTLDTDHRLMGRRATELLLDLIEGARAAPCLELVPTSISARRSTRR